MQKIILYYKFVPVSDPVTIMFWQRALCENLGLLGRIIISKHGINGTLGGDIKNVKQYIKTMNTHPLFKKIQYKWSDGGKEDFPRLSVKVRAELVTLKPTEEFNVFNASKGLKPKQWNKFLKENPEAILFDARNDYESNIGKFKGAITPKIKNFSDIKPEVEKLPKDKPVLTYCTGDIRCEYLSAYMKHKGFKDVYHLDGGIMKYGQEFKDDGYWEGKCFVFDGRMKVAFSSKSKDIGRCSHCGKRTSRHINCERRECNKLILQCRACRALAFCSAKCQKLVNIVA
jgi:UPF0176 protein